MDGIEAGAPLTAEPVPFGPALAIVLVHLDAEAHVQSPGQHAAVQSARRHVLRACAVFTGVKWVVSILPLSVGRVLLRFRVR